MGNLSKNFSSSELGLDKIPADQPREQIRNNYQDFVTAVLQPIRDQLGKPLKISSGYRSPAGNRKAKGKTNSKHLGLTGAAADIYSPGMDSLDLYNFIRTTSVPFDTMIWYKPGEPGYKFGGVHLSYVRGSSRRLLYFSQDGIIKPLL